MIKQPPHNIAAEQAVIGGVLLVPESFWRVADLVAEQDFYRRDHQMLWRAIIALQKSNTGPDAVTLGEWFESQGIDEMVGGSRYILELANTTPSAANIDAYARIVADLATRRRLINAGSRIAALAHDPDGGTVNELANEARRLISDTMPADRRAVISAGDAVRESFARIRKRYDDGVAGIKLSGLSTGIESLDDATGGLQPGLLYVLAAPPSMGKSLVAGHMTSACGRSGKRVAVFSIEMNAVEWADRLIAAYARINTKSIACPSRLEDHEWSKITAAMQAIKDWPIDIDEQSVQSLVSVEARATQMHSDSALSLIVIDHLGLMDIDESKNVARQVGLITKGLKGLAKRLQVPVLLLCQLNRENRGKEPTMTDLRESGRIEEDADGIFMLHRPAEYAPDDPTIPKSYTKLLIRKLRGGEKKTLHLDVDLPTMFVSDTNEWTPPKREETQKPAARDWGKPKRRGGATQ